VEPDLTATERIVWAQVWATAWGRGASSDGAMRDAYDAVTTLRDSVHNVCTSNAAVYRMAVQAWQDPAPVEPITWPTPVAQITDP
jgi:hypothetical protein